MKKDPLGDIVYSTDSNQGSEIPIVYDGRAFAPECGSVFTAKVCKMEGKRDYLIDRIVNYTGYIKKNVELFEFKIFPGEFYRFKTVSPPYSKNHHNYFYVVPIRGLSEKENRDLNMVDPQTNIFLTRLGEFALGLIFDRKTKKLDKLKKDQRNWDWFFKNFKNDI